MRLAVLRILVPAEEGVKVETLQASLQASLRRRGTTKMTPNGAEEPASPDDALMNNQLVFWGATEIRRGAETRAAGKKKTPGSAVSDGG